MSLEDLITDIKSISEDKGVLINLDVSINCNPSKGVFDTKYWLNAPALDVTGYYGLNEIQKIIGIWKESVGTKDKNKQPLSGQTLAV